MFSIGGFVIGLILSLFVPALHGYVSGDFLVDSIRSLIESFSGAFIGSGLILWFALIAETVLRKEAMGMGDVKLLAMLGAFLGVNGVFFIILVSSLVGSVIGITIILLQKGNMKLALPYGPFISLAAIIFLFTGPVIFPAL